jgi:hypothetical protein
LNWVNPEFVSSVMSSTKLVGIPLKKWLCETMCRLCCKAMNTLFLFTTFWQLRKVALHSQSD